MKLTIHQGMDYEECEIIINCKVMDERLKKLVEYVQQFAFSLEGYSAEGMSAIPIEKICYIESVDNKIFLYQENAVHESKENLTALENRLIYMPFVRISKSCLLNITYLQSVKAFMNHRMEGTLKNGEKVMISRTYIQDLKQKMKHNL